MGDPTLARVIWFSLFCPWRLARAAKLAFDVGRRSDRGLVIHLFDLVEACALAERVKRTGCDHVHAHFGTNSATVAMLCRGLGGPGLLVSRAHGPEEFDRPEAIAWPPRLPARLRCRGVSSLRPLSQLLPMFARHSELGQVDDRALRSGRRVPRHRVFAADAPHDSAPRCAWAAISAQKGQLLSSKPPRSWQRAGVDFELVLVGDGEMRRQVEQAHRAAWTSDRKVRDHRAGPTALGCAKRLPPPARSFCPASPKVCPVVIMEALALAAP